MMIWIALTLILLVLVLFLMCIFRIMDIQEQHRSIQQIENHYQISNTQSKCIFSKIKKQDFHTKSQHKHRITPESWKDSEFSSHLEKCKKECEIDIAKN